MAEHKNSVYRKISEDIATKIKSGEYEKGSMLEPERKLMERYGTQRTTIRRALDILVNEGLIEKKTGLGTFVSDGKGIPVPREQKIAKAAPKKQTRQELPSAVTLTKDYTAAAALVFDALENAGHKRIMYIGRSGSVFSAVCGEAAARGLYDKELCAKAEGRYDADIMFDKLWSGIRSGKPTAVIADNADDGAKIMKIAERYRISVPAELTVVCVETTKASEISGCIFNLTETKKQLVNAFAFTADKEIPAISVIVEPEYVGGETVAEVKKDRLGSGKMSDFLL